jgi:hypothetical protein
VKFADRIFLDCQTNTAEIIRSVIVHVQEDSQEALRGLHLLIPCHGDSFRTTQDISKSCFLDPNDYRFNSVKSLGYGVRSKVDSDSKGKIYCDGFENVSVYVNNTVLVEQHAEAALVRIEFPACPIQPGEFREIRIRFSQDFSAVLTPTRIDGPGWVHLALSYLSHEGTENARQVLEADAREIPVRPLYSKELQGGFDVFVYFPETCECRNWGFRDMRVDPYGPDGNKADGIWQKGVWRMRWALEQLGWDLERITKESVGAGEHPFSVEGLVRPNPLGTGSLKEGISTSERVIGWIAIGALCISLLTMVLIIILLLRS